MSRKNRKTATHTVADFCTGMESIAPTALAQDWDNVGLLAGDRDVGVGRVLACIDLTLSVADEAIREKVDLVLAYHPPIFKPITSIRADSRGPESAVFRCIENRIAIYSTHTALDAAEGGTNDTIAALCGIRHLTPLECADDPSGEKSKLVVFVPPKMTERVADAMFAAGAGNIGDYSRCSFRTSGQGSFFGGAATAPTVGKPGRMEFVDENRLETVVAADVLPGVVRAMIKAHPYEEPAFDIIPLKPAPVPGIGRVGVLPKAVALAKLARRLRRATNAVCVQTIGPADRSIIRAIIVVGAAGSLPFRLPLTPNDTIITGEIRHHDALTIQRFGCTAIALGHWASERPVLPVLAERIRTLLPGVVTIISEADQDPFGVV